MVKLLSLYALNFKRLKFDKPVEFREGVTLISGLNEMGKSSVLDAILYALFGRVIRPPGKTKNEDIIGYNANEAIVWLEFVIEGSRFRASRRIHRTKPSRANLDEILPDQQLKPLATEVRRVTEEVERLLGGITFDEIVSSNVVAQKDLNRLIQQRGDDRRKVINVFLNLDSFNVVLEALNDERKDLEGTGIARAGKINVEKEKLETLEEELKEFQRRQQEIQDLTNENQRLAGELEALRAKYDATKSLHEALASHDDALRRKNELQGQLDLRRQALETHQKEIATLGQQIEASTKQREAYSGLGEAEAALTQVQSRVEAVRGLDVKLQDAATRQNLLEAEISKLKSELEGFDLQGLQRLRQNKYRMKPYAAGVAVAFVLAFITFAANIVSAAIVFGAIGALLAVLLLMNVSRMSRLARMEGLLGRAELLVGKNKEMEETKSSVEAARSQKASLESEILQLCGSAGRYALIMQTRRDRGPLAIAEAMLEEAGKERKLSDALSSSVTTLQNQLERTKRKVDVPTLKAEIEKHERQIAAVELPPLPEGVEFSRELLKKAADQKEEVRGEISSTETQIGENNKRIDEDRKYVKEHMDIEQRVEGQRKLVQEIELRIRVVRKAIEAVDKTAEALRNRVKPGVENYMGHILPAITSGRYRAVRLDENYNLEVWDPEAGEFRAKEVFSGGTEDQFLLAMRLAFALALLPEVKGRKPEFLFLDEPLSSSDEVRRSGILEYLNSGLADSFKQIFLISHVGGLEEGISNVIRLEDGRVT